MTSMPSITKSALEKSSVRSWKTPWKGGLQRLIRKGYTWRNPSLLRRLRESFQKWILDLTSQMNDELIPGISDETCQSEVMGFVNSWFICPYSSNKPELGSFWVDGKVRIYKVWITEVSFQQFLEVLERVQSFVLVTRVFKDKKCKTWKTYKAARSPEEL